MVLLTGHLCPPRSHCTSGLTILADIVVGTANDLNKPASHLHSSKATSNFKNEKRRHWSVRTRPFSLSDQHSPDPLIQMPTCFIFTAGLSIRPSSCPVSWPAPVTHNWTLNNSKDNNCINAVVLHGIAIITNMKTKAISPNAQQNVAKNKRTDANTGDRPADQQQQ